MRQKNRQCLAHGVALLAAVLCLACGTRGLHNAPAVDTPDSNGLNGMCLDELVGWEGDFQEQIDRNLDLAFRKRTAEQVFVLVEPASSSTPCRGASGHRIVATLQLPRIPPDEWVAVSYDCHEPTGRIQKGDPLIGIFKKSNDQNIPEPAEVAWRVDRSNHSFQRVESVVCTSFQ